MLIGRSSVQRDEEEKERQGEGHRPFTIENPGAFTDPPTEALLFMQVGAYLLIVVMMCIFVENVKIEKMVRFYT